MVSLPSPEERRAQSLKNYQVQIEAIRNRFEDGDQGAVLEAVNCCAGAKQVLPPWVAAAFSARYKAVKYDLLHNSWDKVWDPPNPGGRKLAALRKKNKIGWKLYRRVRQLKAQIPQTKGIFNAVGFEFGISKQSAEELFNDVENFLSGTANELFPIRKSPRKIKDKPKHAAKPKD